MNKLILFSLLLLSCGQKNNSNELEQKEKELKLKEKEIELKERERSLNESNKTINNILTPQEIPSTTAKPEITNIKFCYVYTTTDEPETKYQSGDINGLGGGIYTVPELFTYKSSIIEIANFDEDKKYRFIDNYEQRVRSEFTIKNMRLQSEGTHAECKIISSECFSFNSYKEASEHRRSKK